MSDRGFQNLTLKASCTCRSTVPHNEHDGLESMAVIVPAAALPIVVLGLPNCGWFNRLNASTLNSV